MDEHFTLEYVPRLERALEAFYYDYGRLPKDENELVSKNLLSKVDDSYRVSWQFVTNPGQDEMNLLLATIQITSTPKSGNSGFKRVQMVGEFGRRQESWAIGRTSQEGGEFKNTYWNLCVLLARRMVDFHVPPFFFDKAKKWTSARVALEMLKGPDPALDSMLGSPLWDDISVKCEQGQSALVVFKTPSGIYKFPVGEGYSASPTVEPRPVR